MNLGRRHDGDRAQDVPARAGPARRRRISTRTFIPNRVHEAIGVFGAVSVATACLIPGSVAHELADARRATTTSLDVEHPTGLLHR